MPASSAAARSAGAPPSYAIFGPFQPCGSPRKNCARSAPRAAASATGSTWSTWAPIRSPVERGVEDVTIRPYPRAPTAPGCGRISGRTPSGGKVAADVRACRQREDPGMCTNAAALLSRNDRGRQVQRRWVLRMRHYELMVILDPELEERTVAPALDQFLTVVTDRRRQRREGRHLGPSPALLRDRQEDRRHLRRHRPAGRAGHGQGARPPAQPQRGRAADQAHPSRPALRTDSWQAKPSSPSSATSSTTPSCASPRAGRPWPLPRRVHALALQQGHHEVEGRREPLPALQRLAPGRGERRRVPAARHARDRPGPAQAARVGDQGGREAHVIELDVDEVGPSLKFATAKVTKTQRGGGRRLRRRPGGRTTRGPRRPRPRGACGTRRQQRRLGSDRLRPAGRRAALLATFHH